MQKDFLVKATPNVSLVTLNNIESDVHSLRAVFKIVADEGISIDMVSQTAPLNNSVNLSFTINDSDTAKVISVIYKFKEVFGGLTTQILSNNTKFLISGEKMRTEAGVAATVFDILAEENVPISLITTAETEISILVADEYTETVNQAMTKRLG